MRNEAEGDGDGERETETERGRGETLLDDFGSDDFAGPAPRRETIEDHEGVLFVAGAVEVGFAVGREGLANVGSSGGGGVWMGGGVGGE